MTGFSCSTCGQWHTELPMCFGPSAPDRWFELPEAERAARAELGADQCVIDGRHFFVLGRLVLPVHDGPEPFVWLAWVSLSEADFMRMGELWHTPGRESERTMPGVLQNSLPYDVDTLGLDVGLRTMPMGERPEIELAPGDHPLALEQRDGITLHRVREIVETVLHG